MSNANMEGCATCATTFLTVHGIIFHQAGQRYVDARLLSGGDPN